MKVFLDRRGQIFQEVLPLAFRNLAIAQQRDVERYKLVRGGGWDRPKAKFKVGDFVPLKRPTASSVEVNTRPHILRIVELRDSRMAVFGGRDGTMMQEQVKHIAHCTVPVGDKRVYPELYDRRETSHCRTGPNVRLYALFAPPDSCFFSCIPRVSNWYMLRRRQYST